MREDKMNKQSSLFDIDDNQQVECLGKIFDSEDQRREYFRNELRKKLPELRKIEGFPKGNDEDIIALSDPPYYTACPNPWIDSFVDKWKLNHTNKTISSPFVGNLSEGKTDSAYMAHAYHTKVPAKAVEKYVEAYTSDNDIILDGFSGSGMTGVGISDYNRDTNSSVKGILNDLSPIATSISHNYSIPQDVKKFVEKANYILEEADEKFGWMFHHNGGIINYIVWSEVFACPVCQKELIYWDIAIDQEANSFKKTMNCPYCNAKINKKELKKLYKVGVDSITGEKISTVIHKPILVNYTLNKKRAEELCTKADYQLLEKIKDYDMKWLGYKPFRLPSGDEIDRLYNSYGYKYVHQLYTKRNLIYLQFCLNKAKKEGMPLLISWITSSLLNTTKMYKFRLNRKMGTVSGTYYVPSLWVEDSAPKLLKRKLKDMAKVSYPNKYDLVVTTGSVTNTGIQDNSIDYIFTDPPFGSNLMYSELNFIWESWLKVFTNNAKEAIVNKHQHKGLSEYNSLMTASFKEYFRVLKPDKWMTVVFSNSKASVWNAIQDAIQKAGFVVANVSALDKKQGSFKSVTTTTAVKQDLVIAAYKPRIKVSFNDTNDNQENVWEFVEQHLEKLPIFEGEKGYAEIIAERTPRVLFDRMVAFFVQKGLPVPLSSAEFQEGIRNRYAMRDGMAFLEEQVAQYDKKRVLASEFSQQSLFVSDENSAIEWIRQQLMKKPQTRQDLQPEFMKEIQHIAKYEALPELDELLSENFLQYKGENKVPDQIVSYFHKNYHDLRGLDNTNEVIKEKAMNRWYVPDPNKQVDLDKLRERGLLREFNKYVEEIDGTRKKLKNFRMEAIRAGFKKAWLDKEYQKIVDVVKHLPSKVVEEDDKLLMYYDNASIKVES